MVAWTCEPLAFSSWGKYRTFMSTLTILHSYILHIYVFLSFVHPVSYMDTWNHICIYNLKIENCPGGWRRLIGEAKGKGKKAICSKYLLYLNENVLIRSSTHTVMSEENVKRQPVDKKVRVSAAKRMTFRGSGICRRCVLIITDLLYLHKAFWCTGCGRVFN